MKIPKYRFDSTLYTDGMNPRRTMKSHMGNFIGAVDEFDNLYALIWLEIVSNVFVIQLF